MKEVFERILSRIDDEQIGMLKRNDVYAMGEYEGLTVAKKIVQQEAEKYRDFDMEFAKKCVELAEKMNVCDLVRENCMLSKNNRFMEAELEIAKRKYCMEIIIPELKNAGITPERLSEELDYRDRNGITEAGEGLDDDLYHYSTEELEVAEELLDEVS